jgi:hypothetical protein
MMLAPALDHARRGFSVFPVYGVFTPRDAVPGTLRCTCSERVCKQPGKHPATRRGLNDASTNLREIERWFGGIQQKPFNIGVAIPDGQAVLDVDPRHGGDETLAALEGVHGPLPLTWRVLTGGGGEHIFFSVPAGVVLGNSAGKLPGLDIKTFGGYVVGAASRHISGRTYAWCVDHHPDEVPMAEMPAWLAGLFAEPVPSSRGASARMDIASFVSRNVVEGGRNVDPPAVLEIALAWNAVRCAPPLGPDEVFKVVESIAKKELSRRKAGA